MRVAIGGDHAGFPLKAAVVGAARQLGHEVADLGPDDETPVDFPDVARRVCSTVLRGGAERAILVCGTGVGAAIAANKIPGIRASVCHDGHTAHQSVEHDDVNVMCIGAKIVGPWLAVDLVRTFLEARFSSDTDAARRVDKLRQMDRDAAASGQRAVPAAAPIERDPGAGEARKAGRGRPGCTERNPDEQASDGVRIDRPGDARGGAATRHDETGGREPRREAQSMTGSWVVFGPDEGEFRYLRPPARSGTVTIVVDPKNAGSHRLAMGHQRLDPGGVIPMHLHTDQEEILFVCDGEAVIAFENRRVPAPSGSTVFVPEGVWHGVENAGSGVLHLLWIITPPGLEQMFRGISAPAGSERQPLAPEEFTALARRHGMHVRTGGA